MLVLYIIILMFTNSINHLQKHIHSIFINRITIITLLISILFTFNTLYFQSIGKGISMYSGLFQTTVQSHIVEIFLLIVGISILFGWPITIDRAGASQRGATQDQYSLIAIFSILGGSLLMSSLDLLSMYLSIELQSFALYILATLNKDKLSATSAGLKYFLLGSLSSCFILLGSAIIYSYTGLTQFEAINTLLSVPTQVSYGSTSGMFAAPSTANLDTAIATLPEVNGLMGSHSSLSLSASGINKAFTVGLIIIIIGFLFKISAAPFYQWAPDVYDGTPTIVTVWLTIVVKITILIFLQGLIEFTLPLAYGLTVPLAQAHNTASLLLANLYSSVDYPAIIEALSSSYNSINTNTAGIESLNLNNPITNAAASSINLQAHPAALPGEWGVQIKNLLLISSLLSLLIGTIAGLSQIKIKRLLAFSSISHVGFLLLALGIYTQKSVDSLFFYLVQYSITSLNIFLILLAFGYVTASQRESLAGDKYTEEKTGSVPFLPSGPPFGMQASRDAVREGSPALLGCFAGASLNNKANSDNSGVLSALSALSKDTQDSEVQVDRLENKINDGAQATPTLTLSDKRATEEFIASPTPSGMRSHKDTGTHIESLSPLTTVGSLAQLKEVDNSDVNYLIELKGQLYKNPVLSISLAICLFSMAGIPPLIGFFSKQFVLFSSIENGNNFLSVVAILVSVISASYYLRLIKITFFESPSVSDVKGVDFTSLTVAQRASLYFNTEGNSVHRLSLAQSEGNGSLAGAIGKEAVNATSDRVGFPGPEAEKDVKQDKYEYIKLTNFHSYIIAILTFLILFFFLDPSILLNGTQLISLTIFNI